MVAQPPGLVADLLLDAREELRGRGVQGAGEHHVLPDQEAHLVAEVVERHPTRSGPRPTRAACSCAPPSPRRAAPRSAPGSGAGAGRRRGSSWRPCRRRARRSRGRLMDSPARSSLFTSRRVRSPSRALRPVAADPDGEIVQGLLAVPVGPPQPRVVHDDIQPGPVHALRQSHGPADLPLPEGCRDLVPSRPRGRAFHDHPHPASAPPVALLCRDRLDAHAGGSLETDVPLDAARP